MKRKITTLLAGLLSVAVFAPVAARACDGACAGGNNTNMRHHLTSTRTQPGAGAGLNNGVNLSLDQSKQTHNQNHGRNWTPNHKKQKNISG